MSPGTVRIVGSVSPVFEQHACSGIVISPDEARWVVRALRELLRNPEVVGADELRGLAQRLEAAS